MFPSLASLLLIAVGCFVALTVGCDKGKSVNKDNPAGELGEPIGAEVPGKGNIPPLALALAVSKGQDPVVLLPKVVGAVSSAVSACPAFVAEGKESADVAAFSFNLEAGKLMVASR